jgi:hypothetical protein
MDRVWLAVPWDKNGLIFDSTPLEAIYGDGYRFTNQLVVRFLLTRRGRVSFLELVLTLSGEI